MVQIAQRILFAVCWIALGSCSSSADSADRTTLLVPLAHDAVPIELPTSRCADQAFGEQASAGWKAYVRLWQAHQQDPSNESVRRFLGLPLKDSFEATARRGRSAPSLLQWKLGSYAQVDTPHFVIYSQAGEKPSKFIAEDLERAYWAWTQLFFPLWEASAQVTTAIGALPNDVSVTDFLKDKPARITIRRKMKVVLFRDAEQYAQTLAKEVPGVERSSGYYDNSRQIIFLYASADDDAATRRHELVHQMFREATRSGLRQSMPASDRDFWLIEGIAGYFESLFVGSQFATVGGWDASRLQFARFRVLVNGDQMPFSELRADGWTAAQQRPDIARWYAHAIAQTHHLMDGGDLATRPAVYQLLAELYQIDTDLAQMDVEAALADVDRTIQNFLTLTDAVLIANPPTQPPKRLVLAGCQVTPQGLNSIPPAPDLDWLDLAGLPIGNADLQRLAPNPLSITQLRLERTQIDARLQPWLARATELRELDVSSTPLDDEVLKSIATDHLSILWLTGSKVTDASIDVIVKMKSLESVDLQKTLVTEAGIGRLRAARPKLEINPLQVN